MWLTESLPNTTHSPGKPPSETFETFLVRLKKYGVSMLVDTEAYAYI